MVGERISKNFSISETGSNGYSAGSASNDKSRENSSASLWSTRGNITSDATYKSELFNITQKDSHNLDTVQAGKYGPEQTLLSNKQKLLKKLNIDENKIFDNPQNTKIEYGKQWILRRENYPDGKEKTTLYYKKLGDNGALVSITKRDTRGNIIYDYDITIDNLNIITKYPGRHNELLIDYTSSDKLFDNPNQTINEQGKQYVVRTEKYPNGNVKTRFYYRKMDDNRASISIVGRDVDGEILYENNITSNDLKHMPMF